MRIGVDCFPLQAKSSALRGIGRYGRDLLTAMFIATPEDEWLLYAVDSLPIDGIPEAPNARVIVVPDKFYHGYTNYSINAAVCRNRDRFESFLVLSPVQSHIGWNYPKRCSRVCSIHYDLIPDVFPEIFLANPAFRFDYENSLRSIGGYNAILTMSVHAKQDLVERRRFDPSKICVVGAAANPLFRPSSGSEEDEADRLTLRRLGISGHYILNVGNENPRKGSATLARAFATLPVAYREGVQLVYAYQARESHKEEIRSLLGSLSLPNALGVPEMLHDLDMSAPALFVGWQPIEDLRALYRNAVVMAFPSEYEGFGLPILEALACGSPVIAGDNSSQPEVQMPGGCLVPAADPEALSIALQYFLVNNRHDESARAKRIEHSATFRWDRVAARAVQTIRAITP